MKRVVYILAAVLAILASVIMTSEIIRQTAMHYQDELLTGMPIQWYDLARDIIEACVSLLFAAAAVVQLFKATPRIMLLLSGTAVFLVIQEQAVDPYSLLLMLAAGLLTALYELVLYGRHVKRLPERPVKRGLLIAAGAIAALFAFLTAINTMILLLSPVQKSFVAVIFVIISSAGLGALAVFCFLKNWRTGEFLRVFLVAEPLVIILLWPLIFIDALAWNQVPSFIVISVLTGITSIALVVCVLVHAAKHRREDTVPPEPSEPDAQMAA